MVREEALHGMKSKQKQPKRSLWPSLEERMAEGRKLRERVPRSAHAEWKPAARRADPIALLKKSDQGRVEKLLPIRYGRMRMSPFAFYRGAAIVMASDLAWHSGDKVAGAGVR